MTDKSSASRSAANTELPEPVIDGTLRLLVDISNTAGLEVGIRLHVAGQIISGVLVSGDQFFTLLSEQVGEPHSADQPQTAAEALGVIFGEISKSYTADKDRKKEDPDHVGPPIRYIHLKNSWAYLPGGGPIEVGLWRGQLAQVAGWSLGNYTGHAG